MHRDTLLRTSVIVGFLAVVAITLFFRIRSWDSKERLDRRPEGLFILATLRPIALLLWLGIIAYMIDPAWMAWSSVPLPAGVRWSGAVVYAIGLGLLTWALGSLGPNLTDTVVTRRGHTLVTHGPYRWIRHPFYDAMALLILSVALLAANWFVLICGTDLWYASSMRSHSWAVLYTPSSMSVSLRRLPRMSRCAPWTPRLPK